MKTVINVIDTSKIETSHSELILNALRADEIENLFQQQEPVMVTVLGKFQVTPMLYQLVAGQLESIELNLIEGVEYTPKELIGDADWFSFDREGHREMELCIKHFAANEKSSLIDTRTGTFMQA
jgi:hypothetical protein